MPDPSIIQTTGAVIGSGRLSVESRVKQVAHPTGGVIAELYVKEGDRVKKGQPIAADGRTGRD